MRLHSSISAIGVPAAHLSCKNSQAASAPTLAETEEIQRRLTVLGFDTGGTDGRIGNSTTLAVRNFQRKVDMQPADGYPGIKLLDRLRQGS
jgi:peptidoglycan hydrolase-like protein with peptidoglycan-binding domain